MISQEKIALLVLKDSITKLSDEEQAKIEKCYNELKAIVDQNGDAATMAITQLGLEMAVAASQ